MCYGHHAPLHRCTYIPMTNVMWRKVIYVFVPLGVASSVKFVNSCGNISTHRSSYQYHFFPFRWDRYGTYVCFKARLDEGDFDGYENKNRLVL